MCIVLPRFDEAEDTVASVKFCEKTRHLLANFRHPEKARAGEIIQQVMQHNVSRFSRSEHSLLAAMSEHEGYAMAFSSEPPLPLVTASMTLDYLGAVQIGEWLEVRLEHSKRGRQMAFATVSLQVGDRVVARASAVFAVPLERQPST